MDEPPYNGTLFDSDLFLIKMNKTNNIFLLTFKQLKSFIIKALIQHVRLGLK